ncbi:right-handed parallel beta-helix repeat-containing protein [Halorussus litoreus]|uniref:right-handed parallel beta-helix repeat-containing protein n=1 Tax=Halorussus litoreus TaxID=1710536 RepID=UPI000E24780F|nr:right-handed parallel beta-helix repeat-containing protein [Halorussus litoreus]
MTRRDARTLAALVLALVVGSGFALAVGPGSALAAGGGATSDVAGGGPAGGSAGAESAAQTQIYSCTTIDESGTYVLASDVENGGGTAISQSCIEITADDVTFDGGRNTLDGRGVSHTAGVGVVDAENVTVRNLAVSDWHAGVRAANGSVTVREVETASNAYGIRLANVTGATVANNSIEGNLVGIYADAENATLTGNDFSENEIRVKRPSESGGVDETATVVETATVNESESLRSVNS